MPPDNIVRSVRTLIQKQLLPAVPKRWAHQFSFGLEAYGLKPLQSAASNARSVVANANTAASKTLRLLKNTALGARFGSVFDTLGLVKPSSFVNIDHSDMHGLLALVGAVQTRKGRALPCMVEATYASTIPANSDKPRWRKLRAAMVSARKVQSFTGHVIDSLQDFRDRLGFWPRLVFDRGFANESIVNHLSAEGAVFYIRLKAGRFVEFDGRCIEVKALGEKDTAVQLFGLTLRVIRSPKSRGAREPWYILTNDFASSRNKVVKVYYHRFEIEETFKDIKHIFEYKRTRLDSPDSLKVLLWFVALGIALLYLATRTDPLPKSRHPKKFCSWLRRAYERFARAVTDMLELTGRYSSGVKECLG